MLAGLLSVGSFVGCLVAGVCIERFGRRLTLMVITSSLYFLSFLSIFLADSAAVVLVGRCELFFSTITSKINN